VLGAILQLADGPTINDASLKCVLGLPNLKRLDLAFSNVGDDGVKHVSKLRVLEDLNLKGSDVSDLSVFNLSQMHSLQRLNVEHTKITQSGSRALEAALPECEVQGPHKRELMRFESGNLEKD
jgi:Leucine-rich repeat (LRR) protein